MVSQFDICSHDLAFIGILKYRKTISQSNGRLHLNVQPSAKACFPRNDKFSVLTQISLW